MKPRLTLVSLLAASCLAPLARAGDHPRPAGPMLPAYQQECSACHVAYPPSMLPAPAWQRIMSGLGRHFRTDASIDAAEVAQISTWLAAGAGTREAPPEDRITRSSWFVRKHDEVPAATWKRASIRSASNCAACHTRADQGDFDEHTVRIPR